MKRKEGYLIATAGIVLILSRVTYYVLALGFDEKIESLKEVSGSLIFFFFLYITFKYILPLGKHDER